MDSYPAPADGILSENLTSIVPWVLLTRPDHALTASEAILKAKLLYAAGRRVEAMAAYKIAIEYNFKPGKRTEIGLPPNCAVELKFVSGGPPGRSAENLGS